MPERDNPICNQCGEPKSKHGEDPMTLEPVKCPVPRQEDPSPPRSDY